MRSPCTTICKHTSTFKERGVTVGSPSYVEPNPDFFASRKLQTPRIALSISTIMALPPPNLSVPPSSNTVDVSIINTTASIRGVDAWKFLHPPIKGHEYLATPCFSILIHHPAQDRTLVFDLGIRKDWWKCAPVLQARFQAGGYQIEVEKGVREILEQNNPKGNGNTLDTSKIEAVVWSHWHFDHIGDPSTFDSTTALIVGPGFKEKLLPGYPTNPASTILEADYAGRELRELDFTATNLSIGRFAALDYFGDGSFYFLDAPGHAVGHICGFARVKTTPGAEDSFVFLGGDAAHHGGELRPSVYLPLPESISPHPFTTTGKEDDDTLASSPPFCPGSLFDAILASDATSPDSAKGRCNGRTQPFYKPSTAFGIQHDAGEAERTIAKLQEVDVTDNVLVVLAHDESLLDVVDFYPAKANDFVEKGWVKKCRWRFLRDFAGVVGWPGSSVAGRKRDWSRLSGTDNQGTL